MHTDRSSKVKRINCGVQVVHNVYISIDESVLQLRQSLINASIPDFLLSLFWSCCCLYMISVRKVNAGIALRRKLALSSTASTVLTMCIRLIRCRTKKEVEDIVLSSTVPIIRESCIDGRWRNALITGKDTKIVLAKRLSGCFAFQRK